jgi:uncharacterized protein involved in tellurium resistance
VPLSRPDAAPLRPDLPWLRRRRLPPAATQKAGVDYTHPRRATAAQPAPVVPPPVPSTSAGIDYSHPRRRPAAPDRPEPAPSLDLSRPAAPQPTPSLDLSRPAAPQPSLDLSRPAAPQPAPSLDLSRPAVPAPSLDLSRPPTPAASPADDRRRRTRAGRLPYPRVRPGETLVLDRSRPTVTLTRLQSGVGALRVSLLRGPSSGDVELGLVCQTTDGTTSVVQRLSDPPGSSLATPGAPLPLVRLSPQEGVDTLSVHLRQVRRLRRALVYGYSPSDAVVPWQGVVVVRLQDDTRFEVPVDLPPLRGTLALLTVYAVAGELVLRAELEPCPGPPEAAAQAYGFAHAWLDGRLPVPAVAAARGRR